ncbi:MAG: hypothetical protein MR418_06735 [Clostridiales bacterium]|nr:hypothetical protein [Clostridiales bacterium]
MFRQMCRQVGNERINDFSLLLSFPSEKKEAALNMNTSMVPPNRKISGSAALYYFKQMG